MPDWKEIRHSLRQGAKGRPFAELLVEAWETLPPEEFAGILQELGAYAMATPTSYLLSKVAVGLRRIATAEAIDSLEAVESKMIDLTPELGDPRERRRTLKKELDRVRVRLAPINESVTKTDRHQVAPPSQRSLVHRERADTDGEWGGFERARTLDEWERRAKLDVERAAYRRENELREQEERRRREAAEEAQRLERERRAEERRRALPSLLRALLKVAGVRRHQEELRTVREQLARNYVRAGSVLETSATTVSVDEFRAARQAFVEQWLLREMRLEADPGLVASVAEIDRPVELIAVPGVDGTESLVARARFLQEHCRVSPRKIMLVTEWDWRADELRRRIADRPGPVESPRIVTFEDLAIGLLEREDQPLRSADALRERRWRRFCRELGQDRKRIRQLLEMAGGNEALPPWRKLAVVAELVRARSGHGCLSDPDGDGQDIGHRKERRGQSVDALGEWFVANGIRCERRRAFWACGVLSRPLMNVAAASGCGLLIDVAGEVEDRAEASDREEWEAYWAARGDWKYIVISSESIRQDPSRVEAMLRGELEALGISDASESSSTADRALCRWITDYLADLGEKITDSGERGSESTDAPDSASCHAGRGREESEGTALTAVLKMTRILLKMAEERGIRPRGAQVRRACAFLRQRLGDGTAAGANRELLATQHLLIDRSTGVAEDSMELVEGLREAIPDLNVFSLLDSLADEPDSRGPDGDRSPPAAEEGAVRYILGGGAGAKSRMAEAARRVLGFEAMAAGSAPATSGRLLFCDLGEFVPSIRERQRFDGDVLTPGVLRILRNLLADVHPVDLVTRWPNRLGWYTCTDQSEDGGEQAVDRWAALMRESVPSGVRNGVRVRSAQSWDPWPARSVVILEATAEMWSCFGQPVRRMSEVGAAVPPAERSERLLLSRTLTRAQDVVVFVTDGGRSSDIVELLRDIGEVVDVNGLPESVDVAGAVAPAPSA